MSLFREMSISAIYASILIQCFLVVRYNQKMLQNNVKEVTLILEHYTEKITGFVLPYFDISKKMELQKFREINYSISNGKL